MDKIKQFIKNRKVLSAGIIFALASLIGNILSVLIIGMAHIYDIIHVLPVVIIYELLTMIMEEFVVFDLILVLLAVIIDFIMGIVIGFILKKTIKKENSYLIGLIISFLVYWIIITFQWLPIL